MLNCVVFHIKTLKSLKLLRSSPPLPDLIPLPLSFDTALSKYLREDILGVSQFLSELQIRLSSLPLSMGGLGVTRATDILAFAFSASRHNIVELQTGLQAASHPPYRNPPYLPCTGHRPHPCTHHSSHSLCTARDR